MEKVLAEINIARLLKPLDHPQISEFVENLDSINAIAEKSPGFVWRLKDDNGNATSYNPFNDELVIVNISAWKNLKSLQSFVYHSKHVDFYRKKKEWFAPMDKVFMALWWTTTDQLPDADEGAKRLHHLQMNGPTAYAFDMRTYKNFTDE